MRSLVPLVCSLLMLCAAPARAGVEVHVDPAADFSKYATYELLQTDSAQSLELRQYLIKKIDGHLSKAGLKRVEKDGDLVVEINVAATFGGGMTGTYASSVRWDVGFISADVVQFTDGTLVVAIMDRAASQGIWQGVATKTFNDNDYGVLRKKIDKITDKMFRDFPPQR